jgi:hypothetical protein
LTNYFQNSIWRVTFSQVWLVTRRLVEIWPSDVNWNFFCLEHVVKITTRMIHFSTILYHFSTSWFSLFLYLSLLCSALCLAASLPLSCFVYPCLCSSFSVSKLCSVYLDISFDFVSIYFQLLFISEYEKMSHVLTVQLLSFAVFVVLLL